MCATAATGSGIAVAITYATAWRNNIWAWVVVGVLTLASAGVSLWLYLQQGSDTTIGGSGTNEVTLGRKSSIGTLRAYASRRNEIALGTRSQIDQLEVTSGLRGPTTDSGAANSPGRRSRTEPEPVITSHDDQQDVG
jgi:hypothetical protein